MTNETKLLTEAEVRSYLHGWTENHVLDVITEWRERGLIAPERDPLLIEAREIAAKVADAEGLLATADEFRAGKRDDNGTIKATLAALRRGMELRDAEVERLRHALKMISIVDQGAGGNLTFAEMANSAMRQAKTALTKGEA